jgi:hypothetical protein
MKTLIEELFPTNIRASTNSVTVVSPSWRYMCFPVTISALEHSSSIALKKKSPPTPVDPRIKRNNIIGI